uniref:O-fucosyltransferase family protein n=1 Tax=Kalanchoe fedtschenkoi TaxID=63787 RepID=A0A7N0UA50_KALFE
MPGRRFHGDSQFVKAGGRKKSCWNSKPTLMSAFLFTGFFILHHCFVASLAPAFLLRTGSNSVEMEVVNSPSPPVRMYRHLLDLALQALAKNHTDQNPSDLLKEPHGEAATWKPCANSKNTNITETSEKNSRYILVSANGGLNQQRVAICNAVAVAALLNATLVIPKFLHSNVWRDPSQFGDIYQEKYFMRVLKRDVNVVKELPLHLKPSSIHVITDSDLTKEAKPAEYINKVLPILQNNGAVHFLGFGNRLGFDPIPFNLQRLRCKCNFHALKFVPKIQQAASLLVKRIRSYDASQGRLDRQLLPRGSDRTSLAPLRYLALHLRFEIDMVAYSMCDFGGGENERRELEAYREEHFPILVERLRRSKMPASPAELRMLGRCPLTPEEAALVLAAVGFERGAYIYVAGSTVYGGMSRMQPLYSLFPNIVTKEHLLTPAELEPFRNLSSQLAALDFIACATADVFAMTDSGSQLSSLVSGFRTYHGGAPTLRPNKKWLAAITSSTSNSLTLGWNSFRKRVKKMIAEDQRIQKSVRRFGQSIYRQPRSPECMCKIK